MKLLTRIRSLWTTQPPEDESELPDRARSVAIIMDGNGRWARRRGLPVAEGHRAGHEGAAPRGRGGDRPRRRVAGGLRLLDRELVAHARRDRHAHGDLRRDDRPRVPDLVRQGVRVRFIGRRDRAPEELQRKMASLERQTTENTRLRLWIAFDYGGRAEIVEAARKLVESGVEPREIDENVFAAYLNAPEMPDPDLLIRTSGELRVSNFLLWQLAYTELVFVDSHWPDFTPRDLESALSAYARRRRRFGGR